MSGADWDSEDFVPPPPQKKLTDKWAGEDEEEKVKDSWEDDDDEEEEGEEKTNHVQSTDKKKKKKLVDIIAEKEKKKIEELERRKKEREEEVKRMTPEGRLAEKLRIQKIQEDADLALMTDLVGDDEQEFSALDEYDLHDKDGLECFRKALINKIKITDNLEKELHYVSFVEELCRELCKNMESDDIKKITTILNTIYNEKVKSGKSSSKSKKKKGDQAKLNLGKGAIADSYALDDYGEYDDFI